MHATGFYIINTLDLNKFTFESCHKKHNFPPLCFRGYLTNGPVI